jgi:hypothetical protein
LNCVFKIPFYLLFVRNIYQFSPDPFFILPPKSPDLFNALVTVKKNSVPVLGAIRDALLGRPFVPGYA